MTRLRTVPPLRDNGFNKAAPIEADVTGLDVDGRARVAGFNKAAPIEADVTFASGSCRDLSAASIKPPQLRRM